MKLDLAAVIMNDENEKVFGKGPYLLLRGIETTGSLNAAAKELGMAYTKAVTIINRAEKQLGYQLTLRCTGGRNGGGSTLTENAVKLMAAWDAFQAEIRILSESLYDKYFRSLIGSVSLGCVVLASGKSTRFGANKLLAELNGQTVLDWTLSAIPREEFDKITVVVSDPGVRQVAEATGLDVCCYDGGPLSESIKRGLETVSDTDGCLFVNGDQPLISNESIRKMARAFQTDPSKGLRLAAGETQGSPVLFPKCWYPELMALTGEKGGMSAVKAKGETFLSVEAQSPKELLDADTPEALEIIRASML